MHKNCFVCHLMWNHYVARTRTPCQPFHDFETGKWAWLRLNLLFPDRVAAVLMPNHLHLILPSDKNVDQKISKLGGWMGGVSLHLNTRNLWQPSPPPSPIPDIFHLRRHLRYLALNPCRKKLCSDPLEWYWSTYREVIGATVERPDSATLLAHTLGEPLKRSNDESLKNFRVQFHAYVSGDPSVQIRGTEFPRPALHKIWAEYSVGEILKAAAAAHRVLPSDVEKRGPLRPLFVHLASQHGWRRPKLLAHICGISPRGIHWILDQEPPMGIPAATLCLGDKRLVMHPKSCSNPLNG